MENPTPVVTCFLCRDGKILLCRRSDEVGTYSGKWAGISGYLEEEPPLERAHLEIREETGLNESQYKLKNRGESLRVEDAVNDRTWKVHPFLFALSPGAEIHLDWEHREYRWVQPETISKLDTVPDLWKTWKRVKVNEE